MSIHTPAPVLDQIRQQETVQSPCVRICTLDDDDVCIGCGRTLKEIKRWNSYSPVEQRLRMVNALRRREARGKAWGAF